MPSNGGLSHVVVTPSRGESNFLPDLIDSMTKQTLTPTNWVIVIHNSGQQTLDLLNEASHEHNWISTISINDNSQRKRGGQIAKLVNRGLSTINSDWNFFSKIDADMVLPEDYFECVFAEFSDSEKLGITSGTCYLMEKGKKIQEKTSKDHTRGGLKTYRRECYDQIEGINETDGWDGIDNITAQMHGWETRSIPELEVLHQRRTGSSSGLLSGCFESGKFAHSMGYFPPFILARSIHRMSSKPIFLGGISMLMGYLYSVLGGKRESIRPEVQKFLRNKQKNKLMPWRK